MNFPKELKYSNDHEWVKIEGGVAIVGISDYAQDAMGDIVFINLPQVGDTVAVDDVFGDLESVKAVSDMKSPVSGTVAEINEELLDSPEKLNGDPYGTWIMKVENFEAGDLMDAAAYEAFCKEA